VSPEAARGEEERRVAARVQGWAEDTLAEARVEGGLVDPYFHGLEAALEEELATAPGGRPTELGVRDGNAGLKKSYKASASEYARTGNPGLGPPGAAPQPSERLRERFGAEPSALPMIAAAQAKETAAALAQRTPLFALKLELRQEPSGALLDVKLVESSGSGAFDAFVLRVTPQALRRAPTPVAQNKPLRSLWQVEGWMRRPETALERAASVPLIAGMPLKPFLDPLLSPSAEEARFEYRARLLRVY
jgi:hypothetical protein